MLDDTKAGDAPADHVLRQPEDLAAALSHTVLGELEQALTAGFQARDALTRGQRLEADRRIVELLRADGFTGPRYQRLVAGLMDYGLATFMKWNATGTIFIKSRQAHRPVPPAKITLQWDYEERRDVAVDTVLAGEALFRKHGLVAGRWSPDGGASLTTYFVGAGILAFRPVYLRWYDGREKMRAALEEAARGEDPGGRLAGIPDQRSADPLDAAEFWDLITRLDITDEKTRGGLYWYAQGFTQREAALKVGLSPRALEGRLRRLRQQFGNSPGGEDTR